MKKILLFTLLLCVSASAIAQNYSDLLKSEVKVIIITKESAKIALQENNFDLLVYAADGIGVPLRATIYDRLKAKTLTAEEKALVLESIRFNAGFAPSRIIEPDRCLQIHRGEDCTVDGILHIKRN